MMKKKLLHFDIELEFALIGVSCHLRDYRFVWLLNKALGCDFSKTKHFSLPYKKNHFSQYESNEGFSTNYVFSNRSANGFLINNMKQVDFWMIISQHDDLTTNIVDQIKTINTIPEVQIAFEERSQKVKEQFVL